MNPSNPQVGQSPRILRRHYLDLLLPITWSIVMLIPILITGLVMTTSGFFLEANFVLGFWLFSGLYATFVLNFFVTQWAIWYQDAWVITEDRLIDIEMVSLFNRRMSQITFNQVQDVKVEVKGYLQNLFNYGTVAVQSAGQQAFFQLASIPNPYQVASEISDRALTSQRGPVTEPEVRTVNPTQPLGEILVAQNRITEEQLQAALSKQSQTGNPVGQVLVEDGLISNSDLVEALGSQYKLPSIDLSRYNLESAVVRQLPKELATQHTAIAVSRSEDGVLSVAIGRPSADKIADIRHRIDAPLTFLVADEDYIREAIRAHYDQGIDLGTNFADLDLDR